MRLRKLALIGGVIAAGAGTTFALTAQGALDQPPAAVTPIKHLVVIFDENISYDHYFATYPNAANPAGEPRFDAKAGTPYANGLGPTLLTQNPNSTNPQRIDRNNAVTCSQSHGYGAEQAAFDNGLMDKFVEKTAGGSCAGDRGKGIVMDYYDGNTVTGLWNYAQNFAMSDNSFGTNFGPSTVGAINLISGQTHGSTTTGSGIENGTVIGDPDPPRALDDCAANGAGAAMSGKNVGDLMNARHMTWGWFQGGFKPTAAATATTPAVCGSQHENVAGATVNDYSPHHEPFEYYASTANVHHLPPTSVANIGHTDQANHQYDTSDFDAALAADNLPQVSFLKAPAYEDGHPSNSDPLDEQRWIVHTINELQQSPEWANTAVVLAYDDSDGWYDHVMSSIVTPSAAPSDALNGAGICGNVKDPTAYADRCGFGPRQPLMVISPWAKRNFIDHSLTDQSSVLKFVEDNWDIGQIPQQGTDSAPGDQSADRRAGSIGNMFDFTPTRTLAPKVVLNETTGLPVSTTAVPNDDPTGSGDAGAPAAVPGAPDADTNAGPAAAAAIDTPTPAAAKTATLQVKAAAARTAGVSVSGCTLKRTGGRLRVACTVKGASRGTAVRFRVLHGAKQVANVKAALHGTLAVASTRAVKAGRYALRVTVTKGTGITAVKRTLAVR